MRHKFRTNYCFFSLHLSDFIYVFIPCTPSIILGIFSQGKQQMQAFSRLLLAIHQCRSSALFHVVYKLLLKIITSQPGYLFIQYNSYDLESCPVIVASVIS